MQLILDNGDFYEFSLGNSDDLPLSEILFHLAEFMEQIEKGEITLNPYNGDKEIPEEIFRHIKPGGVA